MSTTTVTATAAGHTDSESAAARRKAKTLILGGLAVLVAGVCVVTAIPARADALSPGTYNAIGTTGGYDATWVFTACGPDCLTVEINPPRPASIATLHRQGNVWTGANSAGGSFTIDQTSMTGALATELVTAAVRLTKVG